MNFAIRCYFRLSNVYSGFAALRLSIVWRFKSIIRFYHDLGGLHVGTDYEMRSIREMCARGNHIRRELIKSTLEVYPIKGYGAVEIGVHTFYHTNKGQTQEKVSGTYKFVQLWEFKDGAWKLARVISYGHNEMHND